MSYLAQFPAVPQRPENIPGNDGYALYREPGFANEQRVYKIHCTNIASSKGNNKDSEFRVQMNWNFPSVKLGANNYVLELDRVRLKIQYNNTKSINFAANPRYKCSIRGLSQSLHYDATKNMSYSDMDHDVYLNDMSGYLEPYNVLLPNRSVVCDYTATHTSPPHFIVLEQDSMNLNFEIIEAEGDLLATGTEGDFSDMIVEREFHFTVHPNPLKSAMFNYQKEPW